jgi:D-alanyl-D-alanine carboxypeptidase
VRIRNSRTSSLWLCLLAALAAACLNACGGESVVTTPTELKRWSGPHPNDSPLPPPQRRAIDRAANRALAATRGQLPGMWLAVWEPRGGTYVAAYGESQRGGQAVPQDHVRIGSLTMTFTATAMLRLIAQGRLQLDDTIAGVLPGLARDHPQLAHITISELLSMQSGIPDYANGGPVLRAVLRSPSRTWTPREVIDATLARARARPPDTPGWSATNYLILGEMLNEVDGDSVEQTVTGIARQAGLSNTALAAPSDVTLPDPVSDGYISRVGVAALADEGLRARRGTDVGDWSVSAHAAAGGMYATIGELGVWAATGLGNALLDTKTVEQRLRVTAIPPVGDYGLGIADYGNGWIGQTGRVLGWESLAAYNIRSGAVAAAAVNETASLPAAEHALAAAFPGLAKRLLAQPQVR